MALDTQSVDVVMEKIRLALHSQGWLLRQEFKPGKHSRPRNLQY